MNIEKKAKIQSILRNCFIDVYKILPKGEDKQKVLDRMMDCYDEVDNSIKEVATAYDNPPKEVKTD